MDPESKIVFYKLRQATFPDEDGLFAVVRWDTDESLKIEKGGISLIRRLTEGKSIGIAANESDVNINSAFSFLNKLPEFAIPEILPVVLYFISTEKSKSGILS